jgi:hypothetical protein
MLIGLGDDDGIPEYLRRPPEDAAAPAAWSPLVFPTAVETDPWESAQAGAWESSATRAIRQVTKKAATAPRTGPTKVLDKILPKTADGKIFGLPAAVAYLLASLVLAGAGYAAYQTLGGSRRTSNPRPRRGARGKKSRRKR